MRIALAAALAVIAGPAFAQSWLCVPEAAQGSWFDPGRAEWTAGAVPPGAMKEGQGQTFVVRAMTDNDRQTLWNRGKSQEGKWVATFLGSDELIPCDGDFNAGDNLYCERRWLSRRTQRFQYFYANGWLQGRTDPASAVFVVTGRCTPLG